MVSSIYWEQKSDGFQRVLSCKRSELTPPSEDAASRPEHVEKLIRTNTELDKRMQQYRMIHEHQLRLRKEMLIEAEKRRSRTERVVLEILDDPKQWAEPLIKSFNQRYTPKTEARSLCSNNPTIL